MVAPKLKTAQGKRFVEAARALGCDEDEAKFNAALGKVARHKATPSPTQRTVSKPTK
jgi:hypothetical protein